MTIAYEHFNYNTSYGVTKYITKHRSFVILWKLIDKVWYKIDKKGEEVVNG